MTRTTQRISKGAIHLRHAEPNNQVVVHSSDEDRFLLTVQEAINACGAWDKMAQFQSQMNLLRERLGKWFLENKDHIMEASLSVNQGRLFFFVVMNNTKFNQELEDKLTELDIEIATHENYNLIEMSVLAIPKSRTDCVESFSIDYGRENA